VSVFFEDGVYRVAARFPIFNPQHGLAPFSPTTPRDLMLKPILATSAAGLMLLVLCAESAADGGQLLRATAEPLSPVAEQGGAVEALGVWATSDGHARLHLQANGRYTETRGQVVSGGRYALDGSTVRLFDDQGFTAKGQLAAGLLTVDLDTYRREARG
jgi:hypothetical protein